MKQLGGAAPLLLVGMGFGSEPISERGGRAERVRRPITQLVEMASNLAICSKGRIANGQAPAIARPTPIRGRIPPHLFASNLSLFLGGTMRMGGLHFKSTPMDLMTERLAVLVFRLSTIAAGSFSFFGTTSGPS